MIDEFGLVPTASNAVVVGEKFGRLSVVGTGQFPGTYRYYAICLCTCGSERKIVRFDSLRSGATVSCGCAQKEASETHGLKSSVHYDRWKNMMDRCFNPECKAYCNYGGRGVTVCDRWHDVRNFVDDLPDGYFDGAEIDRIDNDGCYEPGNIRWVTRAENSDNRRTGTKIEYQGRVQSITAWAREVGINEGTLRDRLMVSKWPVERALTTPKMTPSESAAISLEIRWGKHKKKKPPPSRLPVKTYEYEGKMLTINELALISGINQRLLRKRICERGWSVDRAMST